MIGCLQTRTGGKKRSGAKWVEGWLGPVVERAGFFQVTHNLIDAANGLSLAALLATAAGQRLCNSIRTRSARRPGKSSDYKKIFSNFGLRLSNIHWNNSRVRPCEPSVASQSASAWRF
jgi:hypothetical protein